MFACAHGKLGFVIIAMLAASCTTPAENTIVHRADGCDEVPVMLEDGNWRRISFKHEFVARLENYKDIAPFLAVDLTISRDDLRAQILEVGVLALNGADTAVSCRPGSHPAHGEVTNCDAGIPEQSLDVYVTFAASTTNARSLTADLRDYISSRVLCAN